MLKSQRGRWRGFKSRQRGALSAPRSSARRGQLKCVLGALSKIVFFKVESQCISPKDPPPFGDVLEF